MKVKCWYSGHEIAEMEYANFTRQEIREYERQRNITNDPVKCPNCAAIRKPQWVKKSLGGYGSGCWQWSLIYPYHNVVK